MLHTFLTSNRQELIRRCKDNVAKRVEGFDNSAAIDYGVPLFLQQLVDTLRVEQITPASGNGQTDPTPAPTAIARSAALHGAELLRLGYSVDQVVHDYGDVCQSITALAVEKKAKISADEFRTLNRCLDDAIADAVTSFGAARQVSVDIDAATSQQRFVDEQRRLVDIALQAYAAIKTGNVGFTGATGTLLVHALNELRSLAERIMPEICLEAAGAAPAAA